MLMPMKLHCFSIAGNISLPFMLIQILNTFCLHNWHDTSKTLDCPTQCEEDPLKAQGHSAIVNNEVTFLKITALLLYTFILMLLFQPGINIPTFLYDHKQLYTCEWRKEWWTVKKYVLTSFCTVFDVLWKLIIGGVAPLFVCCVYFFSWSGRLFVIENVPCVQKMAVLGQKMWLVDKVTGFNWLALFSFGLDLISS